MTFKFMFAVRYVLAYKMNLKLLLESKLINIFNMKMKFIDNNI